MENHVLSQSRRKGFTMIEVVVALALLMLAAAAFLPMFIFAAKSSINSNVRLIATNLAQSSIESIKSLDYDAIGTYTMVNSVKVYGNPGGEIERSHTNTVGNRTFTVVTDVRWKSQTSSGQTDSMAYKQVNVSVQYLSGFSGAQVYFANMDALVSREGERTIVNAGDLQVKIYHRSPLTKSGVRVDVRLSADPLSLISTLGFTDSTGVITFSGLTPRNYFVQPNPSAFGMMVKPTGVTGSGFASSWVYYLEKPVQSWTSTPAEFEVDWPAHLNLTLEDYNGNQIASSGMNVKVIPQINSPMEVILGLDTLVAQDLWSAWTYNLNISPAAMPDNIFNMFGVNDLTAAGNIVWNGSFPTASAAQTIARTMPVRADQPTVLTPAAHHQAAAPVPNLIEAPVGTVIPLHAQPSFATVLYSTDATAPSRTWAAGTAPSVLAGSTQLAPYTITALTEARDVDTNARILMDSASTQFKYMTPGSATAPFDILFSCATEGVQIRYTTSTDGSEPVPPTATSTLGSSIRIDRSMKVRAAAFKAGWTTSDSPTFSYTMKVTNPVANPPSGTIYATSFPVELSTTTTGAQIYYTLDPTKQKSEFDVYMGPITVSTPSVSIRAYASKASWTDSDIVTLGYNMLSKVATPSASPSPGTYTSIQNVVLTTTTPGATIYYTIDGTTPSQLSTPYSAPISVASSMTIKAFAYKLNLTPSDISLFAYVVNLSVAPPTASPAAGQYTGTQTVTLNCATSGATIRYTTDGSTPVASSPIYSAPIQVSQTHTIKAYATKSGVTPSAIVSFTYTILTQVAAPTAEPSSGIYNRPWWGWVWPWSLEVSLHSNTDNAIIMYTLDNTEPSRTNGEQYNGNAIELDPTRVYTLKAMAYRTPGAYTDSAVVTYTYDVR